MLHGLFPLNSLAYELDWDRSNLRSGLEDSVCWEEMTRPPFLGGGRAEVLRLSLEHARKSHRTWSIEQRAVGVPTGSKGNICNSVALVVWTGVFLAVGPMPLWSSWRFRESLMPLHKSAF